MDVDQYVFVIVVLEASLFANTLLIAAVPFWELRSQYIDITVMSW